MHLARFANGLGALDAFLKSYANHSAGIEHDLVVILKGYDQHPESRRLAMEALRPFSALVLEMPDHGFDLDTYREAVSTLDYMFYCFLNSFSRLVSDQWLAKMIHWAAQPRVGIVGATGSYQSVLTDELDGLARMWRSHLKRLTVRKRPTVAEERKDHPDQFFGTNGRSEAQLSPDLPGKLWLAMLFYANSFGRILRAMRHFAVFPNFHVRTNGFVLSRRVLDSIRWPPVTTKFEAYCLESGKRGFTSSVMRMGLEPVIVGKDGRGYFRDDWPFSRTFWQGNQENVLIEDNQTLQYETGSAELRRRLCINAWRDRSTPDTRVK